MTTTMQVLSAFVFWLVLYFGYMTYFKLNDGFREEGGFVGLMKSTFCLIPLGLLVLVVAEWHFVTPAEQKTKAEFYGAPIVSEVQSLEGKVFTPQAFVVTEQHILVYDKDGKVYALDGIKLDGIKPEQLMVSSNITYTVYQKGGQMLFGKL